jgi:uncharacterized membrane protein YcaP (DUF421 family)
MASELLHFTVMVETLFGHGKDLDALQVCMRAAVLFVAALVLIRIAGMRAFGRKSSFDSTITIMLGAVLSRPVVGASPFWPTLAGCAVLVVLHRLVGMATAHSRALERVVKGSSRLVYRDGRVDHEQMMRCGISPADLDEVARRHALVPDRSGVYEIVMESSGELSVVTHRADDHRRAKHT